MKFIIYGLCDPRTKEIRYVGKSSSGLKRPQTHRRAYALREKNYKTSWIKSLIRAGYTYEILVLEVFDNAEQLDQAEQKWIAVGRAALGRRFTNLTSGGEGLWKPVKETRRRLSAAQKKIKRPPHSEETKIKISMALKGRKVSLETRRRLSDSHLGKEYSARRKKDLSETMRNMFNNRPDVKEKISKALLGRFVPKEWRDKIGEANRKRVLSDKTRKKMSASQLARKDRLEVLRRLGH